MKGKARDKGKSRDRDDDEKRGLKIRKGKQNGKRYYEKGRPVAGRTRQTKGREKRFALTREKNGQEKSGRERCGEGCEIRQAEGLG